MSKPNLFHRVQPTKFRAIMSFDWFRKFTMKERIKILCGFNMTVAVRIPVEHSPGKYNPVVVAETSKFKEPSDQVKDRLKNVLEEHNQAKIRQ